MATNDYCDEYKKAFFVVASLVAIVVLLWPLFLYQSAATLYLNVDVAIFANFGNQKITVIFLRQNPPSTGEAFCILANFLVAGKST